MTDYSEPSITVKVDVTNPGQFFACCGLLELADRLWPGAEGWFEAERQNFSVACKGILPELLAQFSSARLQSSLTDEELKRLGSLLSAKKKSLTKQDQEDKERLRAMWQQERIHLSALPSSTSGAAGFDFWLDWWRDSKGERTALKTWAAKQMVYEMARRMFAIACRQIKDNGDLSLFFESNDDSLPFYFDSDLCRTGAARDAGFSADTIGIKSSYRPLLELLAFIAFQRFQPAEDDGSLIYCAWSAPLSSPVAAVAAAGLIAPPRDPRYSFGLFNRTKYMKAFLPANPIQGA